MNRQHNKTESRSVVQTLYSLLKSALFYDTFQGLRSACSIMLMYTRTHTHTHTHKRH